MRYQDAIDYTQQLSKTCKIPGLLGQTWGSHSLSSEGAMVPGRSELTQREKGKSLDQFAQRVLPQILDYSDPYFVDRGLVELVERMGPSLPMETRLHPKLFPSRYGCLWFDRPISMPSRRLADDPARPGLPTHEPAPMSGFAWEATSVGAVLIMIFSWAVDNSNPSWLKGTYIGNVPLAVTPWDFSAATLGTHISTHNREIHNNPNEDDTNNAQRFVIGAQSIVATLLLMSQTLVVSSSMPIDRASRKRALKAGWKQLPNVQVVTLRRLDYSHIDHEPRAIDWSCRWLVREHWRTLDRGLDTERTVLIPMYMKGPEDKPIKPPSQRVFAVVR